MICPNRSSVLCGGVCVGWGVWLEYPSCPGSQQYTYLGPIYPGILNFKGIYTKKGPEIITKYKGFLRMGGCLLATPPGRGAWSIPLPLEKSYGLFIFFLVICGEFRLKKLWNYAFLAPQILNVLTQGGAAPCNPLQGASPLDLCKRLAQPSASLLACPNLRNLTFIRFLIIERSYSLFFFFFFF